MTAKVLTSCATLEEFLQQKYMELYEDIKSDENKALSLKNNKSTSNWFYQGAPLGYVVDKDGNSHYFINKAGLPDEIRNEITGGDVNGKSEDEITYLDYANMTDVYGVTSNLKVYYCKAGKETMLGIREEELDVVDPKKEIFPSGSEFAKLLTGNDEESVDLEKIKSITELTINKENAIKDFKAFYNFVSLQKLILNNVNIETLDGLENAMQMNYIYIKNSVIGNYSALGRLSKTLKTIYFCSVDDNEFSKFCSKETGIGNYDMMSLKNLGFFGVDALESLFSGGSGAELNYRLWKSSDMHKSITSLKPFENLSISTKNVIKNLLLGDNEIIDDAGENNSSYLSDFIGLKHLDLYANGLKSLSGLKNMTKLQYLRANNNNLGADDHEEVKDENLDAISSLSDKESLFFLDLGKNPKLKWIEYLSNLSSIKYLYLDGCDKNMNCQSIVDTLGKCGTNYTISGKLLTGSIYKASDYYSMSTVTNNELYGDLYNNKYISHLSLAGCTTLTNEQLNTILSSMTSLKYLDLQNCSNLSTIDFVGEGKVTGLVELILYGTKVINLVNLNNYGMNMRTLALNNAGVDLSSIVPCINRLIAGQSYWLGANRRLIYA